MGCDRSLRGCTSEGAANGVTLLTAITGPDRSLGADARVLFGLVAAAAVDLPVVCPVRLGVSVDHLHDVDLPVAWPALVVVGHHPMRRPD